MGFRLSLKTLYGKILLVIVGLCAAIGLISSMFLEMEIHEKLHQDLKEKGLFIAKQLAKASVDPILTDSHLLLNMVLQEFRESDHDVAYVYIRGTDGRILAHTFSDGFPEDFLELPDAPLKGDSVRLEHYRMNNEVVGDFAVPILRGELGMAHLGISEKAMLHDIGKFVLMLQGLLLLLSLAGGAVAIMVASTITRPLRSLTRAAASIGDGNFQEVVDVNAGADEVGQLSRAFNAMSRRLAQYHAEVVRSQEELEKEIAEQRQTEEALRQSEEMFRSLSENSSDFIIRFDRDLTHLYVNRAYAEFVGRPAVQITGKDLQALWFDPRERSQIEEKIHSVFETGRSRQWEMEIIRRGGNMFLDWRVSPEQREGKRTGSVLTVCRDTSLKRRLEQKHIRVQNLESLGTLAGGIAHDFNNLLTMVFGNIDLALMHMERNTRIASWLREAAKASEQAQYLTGQLLTFSKGGTPVKKAGSIDVTLGSAVTFALSGTNIRSSIAVPRDLWPLEFDRGQMTQVFSNIVLNAIQAMPNGGSLQVVAKNERFETETTLLPAVGPYVCISFRDTGQGIEPDMLSRVFDPYFTTKGLTAHRGAGLGLSICHSIVQRHGGYIGIESEPGKGTVVTVYLPATPGLAPESPGETARQHEIPPKPRRILIMEDEPGVAEVGRTLLQTMGWVTTWAENGEEALRLYEEALTFGDPFDAVLLDLTVRGGLGGRETLPQLLAMDGNARAVVASGYASDDVMTHYRNYGFRAAVRKPYTLESLSHALERAMNGQTKPEQTA